LCGFFITNRDDKKHIQQNGPARKNKNNKNTRNTQASEAKENKQRVSPTRLVVWAPSTIKVDKKNRDVRKTETTKQKIKKKEKGQKYGILTGLRGAEL
jgi:hypothetical protein